MASTLRLVSLHIAEDARRWTGLLGRTAAWFGTNLMRDACLTTLFVVAPVLVIYASRSLPAIVAVALAYAVAYTLAAHVTKREPSLGRKLIDGLRPAASPWWVWCTLALIAYAALSSLWAVNPGMASEQSTKLVLIFLTILALQRLAPPLERPAHRYGAAVGIALAALILIAELSTDGILRQYVYGPNPAYMNRCVVTVSLLMWPTLALTTGAYRHWARAGTVALVVAAVALSSSESALLAIAAGLLVTGMALVSNRLAVAGVIVVSTAAFIAMPMTVQVIADLAAETGVETLIDLSSQRRLEIWAEFSRIALVKPVFGWGLESSRYFGVIDVPGVVWSIGPVHHPHNPILQIWVELGAIGVVLAGLVMVGVILSVSGLPGRRRSFAYGAITATLAISSVSHGAWQSWWICLLMLIAALFTFEERYLPDATRQAQEAGATAH